MSGGGSPAHAVPCSRGDGSTKPLGSGLEKRCTDRLPPVSPQSWERPPAPDRGCTPGRRSRTRRCGFTRGSVGTLCPVRAQGRPPVIPSPAGGCAKRFLRAAATRPCAVAPLTGWRERATRHACGEAGRRCCDGARSSRSRCWPSRPRLTSTTRPRRGTTRACCATCKVRPPSLPASSRAPTRPPPAAPMRVRRGMPARRRSRGTAPGRRPPDASSTSRADCSVARRAAGASAVPFPLELEGGVPGDPPGPCRDR